MAEREQAEYLALAVGQRILLGSPTLFGVGGDELRAQRGMDVASPAATARIAETTSVSAASLRTYPLAPASNAART